MENFGLNPTIDGKILCYPEIRNSLRFKKLIALLKEDKLDDFFLSFPEGEPSIRRVDKISENWTLVYVDIDFNYDLQIYYTLLGNCNDKYKFSLIPRNKEADWNRKMNII